MAAFIPSIPTNAASSTFFSTSSSSKFSSSFTLSTSSLRTQAATLPAASSRNLVKMMAEPKAAPVGLLKQTGDEFADKVINSIRFLAIDAVEKAKSGHPGMPMGMAPTGYVLWDKIMNYNPANPKFFNRDRFVLSCGHGSMFIYALLYLFGYTSLSIEDLKQFRQLGSKTPGHPENFETEGVEVTTGPLGQGICNGVGLAMAEAHLAATYNKPDCKIVDHYTYVIMGDGCVMEGVSAEACSLAGHLGLGKLIAIYDDNHISIDGRTTISFTEDVIKRYEAYGWHIVNVPNGNTDIMAIQRAIEEAKKVTDKPSLINVTTIIGYGSPNKADSYDVHGAALGASEVQATRDYLGWPYAPFEIPKEVTDHTWKKKQVGADLEAAWNNKFAEYKSKYPELAAQFEKFHLKGELSDDWEAKLKEAGTKADSMATRQLSQLCLNTIAPSLPNFLGGSADLASSNLTIMKGLGDFQKATPQGRNLRFGVREHGMGAICNGIALHGSFLIPYCATFFIFTDYMRAAMRVAALSQARVIYVMTHDSVALGEDGPTHQPIEHLASFRCMPNIHTFRPCDGTETAAGYASAIKATKTPTIMVLTRQKLPNVTSTFEGAQKGAYILSDNTPAGKNPDSILIATGSEVELVVAAGDALRAAGKNCRVVSMPCMELFEEQDENYRESILPAAVPRSKRLAVEAASSASWYKYADNFVCIDKFGISAPGDKAMAYFGLTKENVTAQAMKL